MTPKHEDSIHGEVKMFEQYDECFAIQYTSSGKRMSAYNAKLHTCRVLYGDEKYSSIQKKHAVLVYPSSATWQQKQELRGRTAGESLAVKEMISEAEAVVRYHCFQNRETVKNGLIRVIDIHKYNTDITVVRVDNSRVKSVFGQCIPVGGDTFTEKMLRYYMDKLTRVKGDITGDVHSIRVLKDRSENAKLRMGKNRMKTDEFIFRSPKDNVRYLLRIFREDYNRMINEIMEIIFSADKKLMSKGWKYGYGRPEAVILAGGMNQCEQCVRAVKENYEDAAVLSYKCRDAAILGAVLPMTERG